MLKRAVALALLCGGFVYVVVQLLLLRFDTGDVYARYSTLRADPLGARAYYEALGALPGLRVERSYRPAPKLRANPPDALFYVGTPHFALWPEEELEAVEAMVSNGMRLVITFVPAVRARTPREVKRDEAKEIAAEEEKREAGARGKGDDEKDSTLIPFDEVAKRWGFAFAYTAADKDERRFQVTSVADSPLEPELSWHSMLHFAQLSADWRTLYETKGGAVLIERPYGTGSIVLASDSYFISNEGLRKERAPQLLAWLPGRATRIVFDEESHGVREETGIMGLMKRNGLLPALGSLALIAVLFVWKNRMPLAPRHAERAAGEEHVSGKDAGVGFVNLLRRSISQRDLLSTCVAEWTKSAECDAGDPRAAFVASVAEEENARPARQRDPVGAYRRVAKALASRREGISSNASRGAATFPAQPTKT